MVSGVMAIIAASIGKINISGKPGVVDGVETVALKETSGITLNPMRVLRDRHSKASVWVCQPVRVLQTTSLSTAISLVIAR
ncbi:hypothetical protein GCM10007169_02060 [Shewanella fodinae]|nr:hypothetical protein GCM10007169_02060 [Shewanella fodinae]